VAGSAGALDCASSLTLASRSMSYSFSNRSSYTSSKKLDISSKDRLEAIISNVLSIRIVKFPSDRRRELMKGFAISLDFAYYIRNLDLRGNMIISSVTISFISGIPVS
jgi:hypothetical protein